MTLHSALLVSSRSLVAAALAGACACTIGWAAAPTVGVDRAPAAAASAEAEDLPSLLARVRAATGVDRLLARRLPVRAEGRSSLAGVEGPWQMTLSPDGQIVQRLDGEISFGSASRNGRLWMLDLGGEVRELFGSEAESQQLLLLTLDHRWLLPAGPLELTLERPDAPDSPPTLGFTVRGGRMIGTIELHRSTWLPARLSYRVPGESNPLTTVNFLEWIEFDGVQFPSKVTTTGGDDPSVGSSLRIERLFDGSAGDPEGLSLRQGSADARFDPAALPGVEVVRAPTGHLLVHPLINGQDVGWFIFDTGAGMNILTTSAIASLQLPTFGGVPAKGIGGSTASQFCRPNSLSLGPVTLDAPLMVGIDLSFLDQHMGRKIGGLIGFGMLARVVARLDMHAPSIELFDPDAFAQTAEAAAVNWQTLVLDQRIPHVEASFAVAPADAEGDATVERVHRGRFRLDTGAAQATVAMHEPAVRELRLLEGLATTDGKVGGVGGSIPVKRATLAWFELAGLRTPNVKAEFALESKGAFADPYSLGNIGGKLLEPFVLIFDYRNGRMGFERRE